MNRFILLGVCILAFALTTSAQDKSKKNDQLKGPNDKVSYGIGVSIGKNFKMQSLELNLDKVLQGMRDAFEGKELLMSEQEINDTMIAFQKSNMERQKELAKKAGEKAKKEGEEFLAANKKKDSVVTTPDGLQYKILREGTGPTPTSSEDTVSVNYRGYLIDGKEFDNSYKRGKPTEFPLNHVIIGWTEALQMMKVGSKWQIFIPSELGYGERGMQGAIPPNSTLIFEVELLSVKSGEKK